MTLQPIKDMREYKRLKQTLQSRFESDKTGEQNLFEDQTRILKPLLDASMQQQDATKNIQKQLVANQKSVDVFTKELQRRNDNQDLLMEQPFYQSDFPIHFPTKAIKDRLDGSLSEVPEIPGATAFQKIIDLDRGLSSADKYNLLNMSLEAPSEVFKNNTADAMLEKIKTFNRSIGQCLRIDSKSTPNKIEICKSRKKTLSIYKSKIDIIAGAQQFVKSPKSKSESGEPRDKSSGATGNGLKNSSDVIYYNSVDDLCSRLELLCAAKRAGNTGLNNNINSILDELLNKNAIDKTEYNNLFSKIF